MPPYVVKSCKLKVARRTAAFVLAVYLKIIARIMPFIIDCAKIDIPPADEEIEN
jgi:hypothetical protein